MQSDGNFVVYVIEGHRPLWATNTEGKGDDITLQDDGNLVIYKHGYPTWATGTEDKGANKLVMQDDGNLVLYSLSGPVWASNTMQK